jgi:hypothetical protein
MTRNQELNVLHVRNATEFAKGIDARIVSSDTLIFDFIYFLHPVNHLLAPPSTRSGQDRAFEWPVVQISIVFLPPRSCHGEALTFAGNVYQSAPQCAMQSPTNLALTPRCMLMLLAACRLQLGTGAR